MDIHIEHCFIDECVDKIQTLAALSLYGDSVELEILVVIHDACRYLILSKPGDPELNLLAFKERLAKLAAHTHRSLPHYKKTLAYAASLIVIHQV
ncbi:hypothetical protein [Collimonas humicola]|uniref:hypothetical protein n=1 Tax=Collimonas humicola TaxID=2825886 RepID=UPI001B8BDFFD|nr:hypothetical protein [Collimonas humicola]